MSIRLLIPALLGALVLSQTARSEQDGINGYSGQFGKICTECHSGGQAPMVSLEGPAAVPPGWLASYVLKIAGGQQTAGGLDVSASAGSLIASDPGTHLENGEVTHDAPRNADGNGDVTFTFDWTSPATLGSETFWAAGNSVNLNGQNDGDFPDALTMAVEVRELAFDGFPNTVPPGGPVNLHTAGGLPGALAALAVVDVNGFPFFQFLLFGTFDINGEWLIASPLPPGVSGLDITFMSFGIGALSGKVRATNLETLSFQ